MALLNTYGSANRVVTEDKVVTYSINRIQGEWTHIISAVQQYIYYTVFEYHRYCTKTYSYVGMDLTTARDCAAAMVTKYTRNFENSDWDEDTGTFNDVYGGSMCMADIAIQQTAGPMYSVVVSVREEDTKVRTTITSPASLFSAENSRDYDEN